MKKLLIYLTIISTFLLSSCSEIPNNVSYDKSNIDDISITTTIFPYYDFVRSVTKDTSQISMLLPLSAESHTYEPTPQDIIKINNSDLFIYTGGESDSWIDDIISSIDTDSVKVLKLMDICEPIASEHNNEDSHTHTNQHDEHIWTSPKNAIKIVNEICTALSEIAPQNSDKYTKNRDEYIKSLSLLDEEFERIVSDAKRNTLVFADRFPFTYLANDYGIVCFSAFSGCSEDAEPSIKTVSNLIEKVKKENIPTVFYIEFSNQKLADTIVSETGAKKALFHSCHNITKEEFENGITYIDLMNQNINKLKEALN